MSTGSRAIFLSYASEDATAAKSICEALRAAGLEVWFDQSELRGGDAWDTSIRKQIKNCALFLPIISRTTHVCDEGYFRLEWKLAIDRSHLMVADRPFLVPVVIDDTSNQDEKVPERFREVQWTRLPGGTVPAAFVEHIQKLLTGEPVTSLKAGPAASRGFVAMPPRNAAPPRHHRAILLATIAVGVLIIGYFVASRFFLAKPDAEVMVPTVPAPPSAPATEWGNVPQALDRLETAWRLRDPGLIALKTDPLFDPIRQEPRFKAIERELKLPE